MHYPCYVEGQSEPVGFIPAEFRHGNEIVVRRKELVSYRAGFFDDEILAPVIEERPFSMKLKMRSYMIDVMEMSLRHDAGTAIAQIMDILDRRGCPVGVTTVEVLNEPAGMTKQFRWFSIELSVEEFETVFDEAWFVVDDKSKLIDPACLSVFQSFL